MEAFLTLNPLRHEVQTHSRRVAEPSWIRTFCSQGLCAGASPSASGCAHYRSLALSARITNFRHETSPVLGYRSNLGTPESPTRKPYRMSGGDCTRSSTISCGGDWSAGSPLRGAMKVSLPWR